jgi:uncharacterized LabA/DUF88 family protein/cold shock CspA family protein
MSTNDTKLTKIGVFYDGNYFAHVSNYYNYEHERKARLSIAGLHEFIRLQVAEFEGVDQRYAHIVDAHYFRGRLNSHDANEQNRLLNERLFDDILMNEGVATHYLPLKRNREGFIEEKGIDVWMALEAYELATYKKYDVLALIACDSDYVPLIRKLNTLGLRVMVLGWDFEYTDERTGKFRRTVTSIELLHEASYPVSMHEVIDNKIKRSDSMVNNLFISKSQKFSASHNGPQQSAQQAQYQQRQVVIPEPEQLYMSHIHSLKNGYGFIVYPPNNLYFHYTGLLEDEFSDLAENDEVEFNIGRTERGQEIAVNVRRIRQQAGPAEPELESDLSED